MQSKEVQLHSGYAWSLPGKRGEVPLCAADVQTGTAEKPPAHRYNSRLQCLRENFMQLEPANTDSPIVEVKIPGADSAVRARVLKTEVPGCTIFAPEQFEPELIVLVQQILPSLNNALAATPAPSLLGEIVVLPARLSNAYSKAQLHGSMLAIPLPYNGVSLSSDLLECWVEALEQNCVIERYLFDLAVQVQPAHVSATPAFANNSGLWNYIASDLALGSPYAAENRQRVLLNFIVAEAIARQCKKDAEQALIDSAKLVNFEARRNDLWREMQIIFADLLAIANDDNEGLNKAASAKLLIHLADVATLEKITGVTELSFINEPVGTAVLQKLKYLSSVQTLDLSDSYFPAEALRHLAHLPKLKKLSLRNTSTANTSINHLSSCPSLEEIDCSQTQVNDDGAKVFLSFKKLKRVRLTGARVNRSMVVLLRVAGLEVSP